MGLFDGTTTNTSTHRRRPTSHAITINCLMKVLRSKDKGNGNGKRKTANRKRWNEHHFQMWSNHFYKNRTNGFVHNLKVCVAQITSTTTFVIGVFAFAFDFWLWHCYAFLILIFALCEFRREYKRNWAKYDLTSNPYLVKRWFDAMAPLWFKHLS